jgi:hypothetical protein
MQVILQLQVQIFMLEVVKCEMIIHVRLLCVKGSGLSYLYELRGL